MKRWVSRWGVRGESGIAPRYEENWKEEKRSAFLYRVLSEKEKGTPREGLFASLSREAERQSEIWANKMREAKLPTPVSYVPDLRVRLVAWLVKRWGPKALRVPLTAMKIRGMSVFDSISPGHPMPASVEEIGRRHKGTKNGGNLRAAVFGI